MSDRPFVPRFRNRVTPEGDHLTDDNENGDWVDYADHQRLVDFLERQLEAAKAENEAIRTTNRFDAQTVYQDLRMELELGPEGSVLDAVAKLRSERDAVLAESRKRGEEVVALKYELSRANTTCNDSYQIIVDTDREKHQLTRSVLALTETLREIADRGPRKRVELPSVHAYMTGALESADVMEDYAQAYRAWGDQINSDTARLVLDDTSATAQQVRAEIERDALEKGVAKMEGIVQAIPINDFSVSKGDSAYNWGRYFVDQFRAAILGEREENQ